MSQYFLGVDGGQSRTTAIIGDEQGRVLGVGIGGPSNHAGAAEGTAKFLDAMRSCLNAACDQAGFEADGLHFSSACLGFSGGPHDKEALLKTVLSSDRISLTHDALIALAGATAGEPGLITIAGTGSIAFGRNGRGQTARAGGWGYMFGDEGGAFWIASQALRAALRQEEGWGPDTSLRSCTSRGDRRAGRQCSDASLLHHRVSASAHRRPGEVGRSGSGGGRRRSARNIGGGRPGTGANRRGRSAAIVPGRRSGSGQLRRRCFPERHHFEVIPGAASRPSGTSGSLRPSTAPRPAHCWKPIELQGCGACCLAYQQKSHTSTNNKP